MKTRGGSKASGRRGATMGRTESEKRDEGSGEEEIGGGITEVNEGGEMTERGSREADEGRGGMPETKRGGRRFPSGSGLTGGSRAGAEKELVEENESGTIGVSSVRGDESERPSPIDKKTTDPLSSQGDSGTAPREGRNGEGARN